MKNILNFSLFTFTFSLAFCAVADGAKHIDISQHFVSTNYLNCVAQRAEKPTFKGGVLAATSGETIDLAKPCVGGLSVGEGLTNLAARVAAMDAAGVDTALLGSLVQVWDLPEADAIRVARESNNDIARAMKAYPGRFEGAALLPIVEGSETCIGEAIKELDRCVNEYGFRVWIASSNFGADHLYDAKFEPLLKRVEQRGVKIYLKDAYPHEKPFAALDGEDDPNEWGFALSNGQDLMVTATLMAMNGTFDRYPALRVVLPNLGEYLPFNLDRMSGMINMDSWGHSCEKTLFHYAVTNGNFILTTSGGTNEIPFACAKRVMGADRLCFGTGWPFGDMKAQADAIASFDLTDAERDGVWSVNARRYVFKSNPMKYFRAEDAVAYSNCVHSITNVQQGGELYGMTWAAEADYHLDRAVASSCADGMSLIQFLCTNVLDNAPQPTVAGSPGCTAFMVTNAAGEHLVGRNLDYVLPMAHVLLFVPRNQALNRKYSSVGTVDAGWVGYDAGQLDDGKTDLSYAALFPYYCMDGMNEKGVMVTILSLDARTRPSTGAKDWMTEQFYPDRPNVMLSLALRYLLDNAGTAEEGAQLMENFNVFAAIGGDLDIVGNYHLYICDPSGETRTVEWMPPDQEGGSWQLRVVTNATAISNFYLTDGYGHGSNRWEIARHAIACCGGRLEAPDAMNLCRAITQRKGTDLTSTTHWSVLYNLDTLSADIATFCHFEEIFPYWFKSGHVAWEIGAAKSVKPSVETDLPAYDAASVEAGCVYRLSVSSIDESPYDAWRPSETGACVSAVNRMGCTYEAVQEPIHVAVTFDGAWPNKAVCYADLSEADKFRAERVVAGVNDRGVSARVACFGNAGAAGSVPASRALCTALLTCVSSNAADVAESLKELVPAVSGTGVIFADAMGNVAVWPEGSETVTDDASEMMRYSLDLRQGIYEVDGEGRGQFDELPGLLRLAASSNTEAIVSMGYGRLDVMLPGSNMLWRTELVGGTIPAYGVIADPKAVAHATATVTYGDGSALAVNNRNRRVSETNALLKVEYRTENDFYFFPDGTHVWSRTFRAGETVTTPPAPGAAPFRTPDYASEDGHDWLYNHAIAGKECPDEPATDNGVDLFYVYPTLVGGEQIVIDGFRGIDDATMRSPATNMMTAVGAYSVSARCFADMTHVYAPYYRQATLDTATDCATNAAGEVVADANARYLAKLCEGPAYADVTNALDVYFAKWNKGRPFILAAHSQGSAILRLVMENYFTREENKDKAKRLVCSYQIGYGIGQSSIDAIKAATGVTFASDATGTNVIVSYNTMGERASGNSVLLPPDTLAINPLSWSRNTDPADKDLNLGALTSAIGTPDVIVPDLYGAQVADTGANRGQVLVCRELNGQVLPPNLFGTGSLHAYDYGAYWENLHGNCFDRITAATGRKPVIGKPTDYAVSENWLNRPAAADKGLDVFYLYPTCVPVTCTTLVGEIDDDMKAAADEHYKKGPTTFESYANVYAPYYRQGSVLMLTFQSTMEDTQRFCSTHVIKTDVFAALDWYFSNRNPGAVRPFVLASHSQGSANMKNVLEEYFVGEKAAYTNQLVAAYVLGWKITPDWCEKVGMPFATGADDTRVVMTWNAEGPGETSDNYLTADPTQLAINPINWKTDATDAPKAENLGSVITNAAGVLYETGAPGVTGTRLQANRPGAVIVDAPETIPVGISPGFGTKSYHFEDWGFFHDNIGVNGLNRFATMTDQVFVDPYDFRVSHATFVIKTNGVPALSGPAGAAVVAKNAEAVAVYTAEAGYVFASNRTTAEVALDTSLSPAQPKSALPVTERRTPDYAEETGRDWLYNHAIAGKECPDEPATDNGVDLFYVYPTLAGGEQIVVDGFRGIDDATMRSPATNMMTAVGAYCSSARCFADMTHVYAPFYRQLSFDGAYDISTNAQGKIVADANARYVQTISQGPSYVDVTNALDVYFAKWNNGRKLILAGHSQGSAHLRLLMRDYFTLPENRDKAKLIVSSYQIGFGVSEAEMADITEKTGITFASDATGTNVIVSYNTMCENSSGNSSLLPPDTIAINPLSWSRVTGLAVKELNLGALTNDLGAADVIVPHLYGAQVADTGANRGEVVVCKELNGQALPLDIFGTGSLHTFDYSAYWENLHGNCFDRIAAATGKKPVVGKPSDYANTGNWMRYGDRDNTGSTAKPFDIFYLYPTSTGSSDYVAPVDDDMKTRALGNYRQAVEPLESYANVYAPYYRQISATGIMADPTVDGLQLNLARHVGKTDVFAALDHYFTNVNVNAARPFVLASHSQGSTSLKNAFEQYFVGEKKAYLEKMVAAYTIGYTFSTDWCAKVGVTFATGAADTGVLITWNAEGPDAPALANMLTKDPNGQAINPLNWKRDDTYAPVSENHGSFRDGELVAGVTDALLQPTVRPGALVVSNATGYTYSPAALFGEGSYHFDDWGMFRENACANILDRGRELTGYAKLCATNWPKHVSVTVKADGEEKTAVGGMHWAVTNASAVTATFSPEDGYRLLKAGVEVATAEVTFALVAGEWSSAEASALSCQYVQRAPDYMQAKDWLLNHYLKPAEAKSVAGEPSQDPGVDLVYVYGTIAMTNACSTVGGFADIDDPQMRGDETNHMGGAWGMIPGSVKAFGDYTRVYMPFYRQMTLCGATNVMAKVGMEGANQAFADALKGGVAYEDLAAALDAYFANWNEGRPFILAGCSQGAAMLRNMVQHYFTQSENKSKLDKLVACYGIAYGVTKDWATSLETATDGKIHFATNATERGVYVSWNTVGPDSESIPNGLVPSGAISINPLTWTTTSAPADAERNYGSLTNSATGAIVAHLYDATVDTVKGVVVSTNLPASDYVKGLVWFGDKSLHTWEMSAWWENIRDNVYARIETATGKRPRCGTPNDYSKDENWMVKPETADKSVDVFFLYPTTDAGGTPNLVAEIDGAMKSAAWDAYQQDTMGFWSYANMYAPYYRQASFLGLQAQSGVGGLKNFCSTHVVKTDVFAALDYYFTNLNVSAERPYILVGHSQGSCNIKLIFEEYMKDHADYKAKLVAAYAMGFAVEKSWCEKAGVGFAEGESDTGVIMTWNCEGPDAVHGPVNFLTEPDDGQAINPLNWKTDDTYADIGLNLGSVVTNAAGEYVWGKGNADARLSPKQDSAYGFRPGALVVTNTTAGYSPVVLGYQSFHGSDGAFFQRNVGNNGFTRYAAFAGLAEVMTNDVPQVTNTTWKVRVKDEGERWTEATVSPFDGKYYAPADATEVKLVYTLDPEKSAEGFRFVSGETTASFAMQLEGGVWTPTATKAEIEASTKIIYNQRKPDYAAEDGHDWLFNHDIAAKRYEGEPAQDPGVDLFYFYPTSVLVSDDHCVDGVCDIDDPYLRGSSGASNSWNLTAAVFGDFTHVYAPYYRQTPSDVEMPIGERPEANAKMRQYWYERAPYEDVTNALVHYFTVINPNGERPFLFAGHSHGSGMLTLVMEHFFAEDPARKAWLRNMVACYAIGWGVSKDWERKLNDDLGIYVATNATDAGAYVFWNTYGPNTNAIETILYPDPEKSAASVNPILWTRVATNATADLNLGGWTTNASPNVIPHLYDASNHVANGTIICTSELVESQYLKPVRRMFGEHSLHAWDYLLYWENLRLNAYQRIETATGRKPCSGTPTDYSASTNWMSRPVTSDKPVDVFYLYPTCVPDSCTTLVAEIDDDMKANAQEEYERGPSTFESYANVYAPYYRQGSVLMIAADTSAAGSERFCSTHVMKTDIFAALDYYFTNVNVNAARPFILASHSQGSANMVNVLEEYFVGEKKQYLGKMVVAYVLGWKILPDWCEKIGLPFATGADDTRVVMTWNAEGPGETSDNFLTDDPTQLAINPINWKRDTTEAPRADNFGSVITNAAGALYETGAPGVTGAHLQDGRAGAVIVDAPETIPVGISPGFGTKSYHFEDFGFFRDNVGVNGLNRFATFTDQVFVDPYDFRVSHATFVIKTNGVAALSGPAGAAVVAKNAEAVAVYTAEAGYVFAGNRTTAEIAVDTSVSPAKPKSALPSVLSITAIWLQNVYTNRFTVMCETLGELPDLRLQYGADYEQFVGTTSTNGLKEGTFVCKAQVTVEGAEGETIPYRFAVGTQPITGTEGSIRLWKDEDAAFTCAIWGDNQEGIHTYDWGNDVTAERYRAIRAMFRHMKAERPDFGFSTGDFSSNALYDDEVKPGNLDGAAVLFANEIPYHLVWGNHDCVGTFFGEVYTNAAQRYFAPAATEDEGWFHLYRNNVLFIGVHWTWGKGDAEARYDAITNGIAELLATPRAQAAKFRILVQHTPIFLECYNVLPKTDWFSDTRLLDVAKAGGVDIVFSGHTHAYERIVRDGIVQVVNGGFGYLDHGERWCNNYGADTKVGGHNDVPYLWARQVSSNDLALGPVEPVRMGCLQGYGILSVTNDTLVYKAHAFNADGSYIGVADSFELKSKRGPSLESKSKSGGPVLSSTSTFDFDSPIPSPVDNATWKAYKDAQGEVWEIPEGQEGSDPVVNVSKTEIARFCAALGGTYRLPTVAELTAIFGGDLAHDVSEWTSDVDPVTGYCRILGGNAKAIDATWCRAEDRPAIASADCHANYLGFRVVTGPAPAVVTNEMDKALAALAAIENPGDKVYEWKPSLGMLVDITSDWTNETFTTKYTYENPVIFTGMGDLKYRVRREVTFGGGLAAPNATSLDLSHVLGFASESLVIKGDFRGGVVTNVYGFVLKCDSLKFEDVTYRGQAFQAVTDERTLALAGTNDFSSTVLSVFDDRPGTEKSITNLVVSSGKDGAMLRLRRLQLVSRDVFDEVLNPKTANLTIGAGVTLTTAEDVLIGIDEGTLTVNGILKAAGVNLQGHLMSLLPEVATIDGAGAVETTHFGVCAKSAFRLGVSNIVFLSSAPWRAYVPCGANDIYEIIGSGVAIQSAKSWSLEDADRFGCPYEFRGGEGSSVLFAGETPVTFLPAVCTNTLDVRRDVMLGEGNDPSYTKQEDAEKAVGVAMVARPNGAVKGVVSATDYDAYFDVAAIGSGSSWSLAYELNDVVTNAVQAEIGSVEVARSLVQTITNAAPQATVSTVPGLYYGIVGATNVTDIGTAAVPTGCWVLGNGTEMDLQGEKPEGATDRSFYQIRVVTVPSAD